MEAGTKTRLKNVLWWATFVPYVVFLAITIVVGCTGIEFIGYIEPGFEALSFGFVIAALLLVAIPIIPVCFVIQMAVLVHRLLARRGKKISPVRYGLCVTGLIVTLLGGYALYIFGPQLKEACAKPRAIIMHYRSEEIISYNENDGVYDEDYDNFGDSRFSSDTLMVDWDRNEIGFVLSDNGGKFVVRDLKSWTQQKIDKLIEYDYLRVQCEYVFENGYKMTTYTYKADDRPYESTSLIVIETVDGDRLCCSWGVGEYLHLSDGCLK